jgi:hypothetical protein
MKFLYLTPHGPHLVNVQFVTMTSLFKVQIFFKGWIQAQMNKRNDELFTKVYVIQLYV